MFITLLLTAAVSYAQPQLNKSNIDEVIGAMPSLSIATLMGGEDNIRRFESEVENLWGKAEDGELRWIHRQDDSKDWYFVTPQKRSSFKGSVTFAAVGSVELWNPESGALHSLRDREPRHRLRPKS